MGSSGRVRDRDGAVGLAEARGRTYIRRCAARTVNQQPASKPRIRPAGRTATTGTMTLAFMSAVLMTASGRATVRGIEGSEFDVAERVVRNGALPRPPSSLAPGQSWPVAWHQIDGFAAVLLVKRSPYVSCWRRPRFDLLVAELASEGGGPFVCDSVGGKGPGSPKGSLRGPATGGEPRPAHREA